MPGPPSIFDAPHAASSTPPSLSNYIQPNLGHGLRIWWAFFWPATLVVAFLTFILNFWLRWLYENTNVPARLIGPTMKLSPYVLTYVVALFVMYYILHKNFRQFRIGLLSNRGGEGSELLEPTLRRTVRVWWTYSWRTFVYGLIAVFVTAIPRGVFVGLFGWNRRLEALVAALVGIALGGAVGLFVIYSNILDEDFGDFRVCLLPRSEAKVAPATPAANPVVS
jgi:hypothetical protein